MPMIDGTITTYGVIGQREDLTDDIYNIDPKETPLFSMIGRGKADAVTHEWQLDSLRAVNTDNVVVEGDDATFATRASTVRVGNLCQISRGTLITSGTTEAVSKAGRRSEEGRLWAKELVSLKQDIEGMITLNQGAVAGDATNTVARRMAGLGAWLKSNVNAAATTNNPTYVSGVPTTARTDATDTALRAFTETIVKGIMQTQYTLGAKARVIFVGPYNRTVFSTFNGLATPFVDATKASPTVIQGSADVMVTDFGNVRVIPSRIQRERDAWFIDPKLLSINYLRAFQTKQLAPTGDASKKLITSEYTLKVNNEAGLALAADLAESA